MLFFFCVVYQNETFVEKYVRNRTGTSSLHRVVCLACGTLVADTYSFRFGVHIFRELNYFPNWHKHAGHCVCEPCLHSLILCGRERASHILPTMHLHLLPLRYKNICLAHFSGVCLNTMPTSHTSDQRIDRRLSLSLL